MGSQHTTLCLVNFSGQDITHIDAKVDNGDDWDVHSRPNENLRGALPNGSSLCVRAEINTGTWNGCWFTVQVAFQNGDSLVFRANQWDARTKQKNDRVVPLESNSTTAGLGVFQKTGEDRETVTNTYCIRPPTLPDNSRWMTDLLAKKPDIRLNELMMPGSHDAGMYVEGSEKAITQSLEIHGQLQAGSRYFDLRVCQTFQGPWTYHGAVDYGGSLEAILKDVARFMTANPEETVFLKFRSYALNDLVPTIDMVKRLLDPYLYKTQTVPNFATLQLSLLKGRVIVALTPVYYTDPNIVLMAMRMANPVVPFNVGTPPTLPSATEGLFPYQDYGNEDTGADTPPASDACLGVYDAYAHNSEFAVMRTDQRKKWSHHKGHNKNYLFLLSWTLTGSTDNVLDLDLLSNTANPQLPAELHTLGTHAARDGQPNIVYLDQVEPWICKAIIDRN